MEDKIDLGSFVNENKDLFDKLNEDFMKGFFSPVKEIYFDLPVLKDIRLGLMISLTDKSKIEEVFIKNITKYNNRPNRSFTFAFKDVGYSEEELTKMYYDEKYHHDMFDYALDTDLSLMLNKLYCNILDQNIRAEYRDSVTFNINTYPISTTDENIVAYEKILTKYFKGVKFNFICINPQKINERFWLNQSIIIFDDLAKMTVEDTGIFKPLFQDQVMSSTKIFCPYQVLDDVLEDWIKQGLDINNPEHLVTAFSPTECTMKLVSNFKFIPCKIPL